MECVWQIKRRSCAPVSAKCGKNEVTAVGTCSRAEQFPDCCVEQKESSKLLPLCKFEHMFRTPAGDVLFSNCQEPIRGSLSWFRAQEKQPGLPVQDSPLQRCPACSSCCWSHCSCPGSLWPKPLKRWGRRRQRCRDTQSPDRRGGGRQKTSVRQKYVVRATFIVCTGTESKLSNMRFITLTVCLASGC